MTIHCIKCGREIPTGENGCLPCFMRHWYSQQARVNQPSKDCHDSLRPLLHREPSRGVPHRRRSGPFAPRDDGLHGREPRFWSRAWWCGRDSPRPPGEQVACQREAPGVRASATARRSWRTGGRRTPRACPDPRSGRCGRRPGRPPGGRPAPGRACSS